MTRPSIPMLVDFELPPDRAGDLRRARRIELFSIGYAITVAVAMGLGSGSSQAMRTAWAEDLLGIIPPVAFLVGARLAERPPNRRFPYGYHRATTIAFLCAALAQLATGVFLLVDGAVQLIEQERAVIGTVELFGRSIWQGWVMLAALSYSVIPMMMLGRLKLPLACRLHDKSLATDADLNKDDWISGTMAVLGIGGIAAGVWWLDPVAAMVISVLVCRDGLRNVAGSIGDLMDRVPVGVDHHRIDVLIERIEVELERLPWVRSASVRLREHGNFIVGDAFVVPHGTTVELERLDDARRRVEAVDWRLRGINLVPTRASEW
jgi:cation diffusion facilitator family transporter